ncbi:MAG: hypothetical protein Fur0044_46440 [Anaerolineae bacterium]
MGGGPTVPNFDPAVIFLHSLVMITVDKVEFSGIGKQVLDIFKQPALVAFEGQDIIRLLSHDLSRNVLLATHARYGWEDNFTSIC